MTYAQRAALIRGPRPTYWEWPSVWCPKCKTELSDVVGCLHEARTGHQVTGLPDPRDERAA